MTSKPPAACCASGHEHEHRHPAGTLIHIPDTTISAYLAVPPLDAPPHPNTAILFLPDVLGIAEQSAPRRPLASAGYLVLLPDLYNGDPFKLHKPFAVIHPTDDALTDWAAHGSDGNNPHTTQQVDPIVAAAVGYLGSQHGIQRVGAVGYCFGAKFVVRFLGGGSTTDASKKIDVGFLAHPSYVTEEELWASRGQLSIAAAETDLIFTAEMRHRTEDILQKKGEVWSIALYSQVAHGFAVRGDPESKTDRWAEHEAFWAGNEVL